MVTSDKLPVTPHTSDHPVRLARMTDHLARIGKFSPVPPATVKEREKEKLA